MWRLPPPNISPLFSLRTTCSHTPHPQQTTHTTKPTQQKQLTATALRGWEPSDDEKLVQSSNSTKKTRPNWKQIAKTLNKTEFDCKGCWETLQILFEHSPSAPKSPTTAAPKSSSVSSAKNNTADAATMISIQDTPPDVSIETVRPAAPEVLVLPIQQLFHPIQSHCFTTTLDIRALHIVLLQPFFTVAHTLYTPILTFLLTPNHPMADSSEAKAISELKDNNVQINRQMVRQLSLLNETVRRLQLCDADTFCQHPSMPHRTQQPQDLLPTMKKALEHQQIISLEHQQIISFFTPSVSSPSLQTPVLKLASNLIISNAQPTSTLSHTHPLPLIAPTHHHPSHSPLPQIYHNDPPLPPNNPPHMAQHDRHLALTEETSDEIFALRNSTTPTNPYANNITAKQPPAKYPRHHHNTSIQHQLNLQNIDLNYLSAVGTQPKTRFHVRTGPPSSCGQAHTKWRFERFTKSKKVV